MEFPLNGTEIQWIERIYGIWKTAEAWIWVNSKILSYHMFLTFTVVAFWSLTQEVAGSNPVTVMINIYRPQGKVMFSQAPTIGLMATRSLLILVTARSVRILLEYFLA